MKINENVKDFFRPVLSDRTIMEYNSKGLLVEGELSESQIQPNSIDLTLGNTWKRLLPNQEQKLRDDIYLGNKDSVSTIEKIINPKLPIKYDEGLFNLNLDTGDEYYKIMPGEFVLMASNEILNIPNGILSFVQGRSSIARLGIQTEQAGLIDAGFRGTITFEVTNETEYPIILYKGMRVAQVYFFKAQYANKIYSADKGSKYSGQIQATGSKIHLDKELNK
jgi:dCTP deaminase